MGECQMSLHSQSYIVTIGRAMNSIEMTQDIVGSTTTIPLDVWQTMEVGNGTDLVIIQTQALGHSPASLKSGRCK